MTVDQIKQMLGGKFEILSEALNDEGSPYRREMRAGADILIFYAFNNFIR